MKLPYVFLLFIGASQISSNDAMHAGTRSKIENFPYTAQLYLKFKGGFVSFCGAAILSENWVVTAAHCVRADDLESIKVRVGTDYTISGGSIYNTSEFIVHEHFTEATRWNNDICLLKIHGSIEFNEKVQPISISRFSPEVGRNIITSGYGYDYDNDKYENLQVGVQPVITRKECRRKYSKTETKMIPITKRSFCTDSRNVDLCGGDSGSPAVLNGYLVGIAVEACESPLPNIFTNVPHYYNWIVMHTKLEFS